MTQAERAARPEPFPEAARGSGERADANVLHATTTIRAKRAQAVARLPDWEALRDAGASRLTLLTRAPLIELEAVTRRGGVVHWARDAAEANAVVTEIVRAEGVDEIVKVKSLTTDEIGMNDALEAAGIHPLETDLAELIVQLAGERPSHLLVPAIHKNRTEIRDLFRDRLGLDGLSDDPGELTAAARAFYATLPRTRVAVSARTSPAPTPGASSSSSPRERPDVHDLARGARDGDGIEKVVPLFLTWR